MAWSIDGYLTLNSSPSPCRLKITVNPGKPLWLYLSVLVATVAAVLPAASADTGSSPSGQSDGVAQLLDLPLDKLTNIVVTGTADARGLPKQDAGYSITTLTAQAMFDLQPNNAADVTKMVPGMWAETTGGVAGPNVDVRGFPTTSDTPWVSVQIDGLPIYPASSISWMDNFSPFRLDDTMQRMEATLSGPAVLWGMAQPGATVNFIQKNGLDNPGGSVRATMGTGDLQRIDGYYGGMLAEGWYGSIGGFYRRDSGIRDTQYPADLGYQLSATLLHPLDEGKVMLYGRHTSDQNAFFTAIPLMVSNTGTLSAFPGFDPLTATFYGNNTRNVTLDTAPGQTTALDMAKGRGIDSSLFGIDIDKKFGNLQFSDRMSYTNGAALTVRQESGPLPQSLSAFIASEVSQANGNSTALAAAGGMQATNGTATYAGSGQAVTNLNQQVIATNIGVIDKQFAAFQNEARLGLPVSDAHRLTLGVFYAGYSDVESDEKGAYQLMQVQTNPQVINVKLNNGVLATSGDGILSPVTGANYVSMTGANLAGIIVDEWQISQQLRADAGMRFEHNDVTGWSQNTTKGFVGSDALALYDYNATYRTAGTTSYAYDGSAHAFSGGADYRFADGLNGFARFNQGYQFPNFDNVMAHQDNITHVQQMQIGMKRIADTSSVYLTAFYGRFTGKPQQETLINGTVLQYLLSANTAGIELESTWRPSDNLQLVAIGDYMHGELTAGGPGITGNMVEQQPAVQLRLTPSYLINTELAQFRLYATANHVGERFSDPQNQQRLPAYNSLDIGAVANFRHGVSVQLTGTNVTNTLAITEGNVRIVGAGVGNGNVVLGRPLFGASYQLSLLVTF